MRLADWRPGWIGRGALSDGRDSSIINVSELGQLAADNVTVNEASGLLFSNMLGWSIHIPGAANTGGINFTAGSGDDTITYSRHSWVNLTRSMEGPAMT